MLVVYFTSLFSSNLFIRNRGKNMVLLGGYFYSPDQGVIKSFKLPANFYLLKVEKLDVR